MDDVLFQKKVVGYLFGSLILLALMNWFIV